MATSTRVTGTRIKLTDMASTSTSMGASTKETGRKTNSMAEERRFGQMALALKGSTWTEKSKVVASSCGLTEALIKAIFLKIISMDTVFTSGQTAEFTKALGRTIKCTAMVFSRGQMEGGMKEIIPMIRSKDKEHSSGQTVEDMLAAGSTASSMAKDFTFQQVAHKGEANGRMERE